MDSSVSPKDEIWFLRVCHHISNALYYCTGCRADLLPGLDIKVIPRIGHEDPERE